jgi:hypothetical protein
MWSFVGSVFLKVLERFGVAQRKDALVMEIRDFAAAST